MNRLIQLRKSTALSLIVLLLVCFALSPTTQAVLPSPTPDGGYPGGNTAEGINALHDVNTAVGINNTAVGANALTHNTTGSTNVAVGSSALFSNTTGNFNMAIGTEALRDNNANFNLAIGFRVLFMNTTGKHLTGIGAAALRNNTIADFNTAIGADAMRENTIGQQNTAVGADALSSNTTGNDNTACGQNALLSNTTGDYNTANGFQALHTNTTGFYNTANGLHALYNNTTGSYNTANGVSALGNNTTGHENTACGQNALLSNTSGGGNIALGFGAGAALTTGNSNIDIGNAGVAGESDTIRIGGGQTRTFIAAIRDVTTGVADAVNVVIDSNGQLGTMSSSKRFKKEIKPMDSASEAILALKPVTFHYKSDATSTPQFGLIAEEVAEVNPDLVVRDENGEIYSVRYDAVNAMLLNEFLKEHKTMQEQGATITELKSHAARQEAIIAGQQNQIEALSAGLQKVSTQLELSKPAPQTVKNND
jgi:hypothetical protein